MAWYHEIGARLRALVRKQDDERVMDEEIRFHLEMETKRHIDAGVPPDEARRLASVAFGGIERHKEHVRDERGTRWFEDLAQDIRFAVRSLIRRPGFTAVAAITLALGIGASTTLFGVVRSVLLTPLPYGNPEQVAVVWSAWKGFDQTWLSYDEYEAWDSEIPAIADVGIFFDGAINLGGDGEPERVRSANVGADLFGILGVSPMIGRGFLPEEDRPGGPNVIMLGYSLWQRRFGGDAAIVGRDIQVNGEAATVIGVMPPGFKLPVDYSAAGATEAWRPLAVSPESQGAIAGSAFNPNGQSHGFYGVARLAPGATTQQANRQLAEFVAGLVREGIYPEAQQFRAYTVPVTEQVTGRVRPALLVVLGAVGFVLLIACANVAGLLLVRGEHRRREIAIRTALGARTQRLTRLLLTESVMLATFGGALGVMLAAAGVALVRRTAPAALPRVADTTLDPVVLLFALAVTISAAVLAGLLPALHGARVAPASELKEGGRSATAGPSRLRWRQTLVAAEVALAVVLVVGAGLMIRSVANLFAIDAGFRSEGVLTMRLSTPSTWYTSSAEVTRFHDDLQRRVAELPGVASVGAARLLPLAAEMGDWGLSVEGYTPPPGEGTPGDWQVVTPGYFETMRVPLISGRYFDNRDDAEGALTMIVNRALAEKYFAGRDPLGGRVRVNGGPPAALATVVGVVEDVRQNALTTAVKPQFYVTHPQFAISPGNTQRNMSLVVRTDGDPNALIAPIRALIRGMDPRLPVSEVRTMDRIVGESIAEQRFTMGLLGLFGVLALALSAIGIFGIVSQIVATRRHELGIRAALGATPGELVMLSLRTGVRQTIAGLVIGIVLAFALTRALAALLHGVTPTDPLTFATVLTVTAGVALLATLGPARRAGRVNPVAVLHEG
jgi:putative ABC transport system permease protein